MVLCVGLCMLVKLNYPTLAFTCCRLFVDGEVFVKYDLLYNIKLYMYQCMLFKMFLLINNDPFNIRVYVKNMSACWFWFK